MIDREQNLRLGDARKLSQMMQGESVPSSGLSKQMAEELLSEDLIWQQVYGSRRKFKLRDANALSIYLAQRYGIQVSLDEWIKVMESGETVSRARQVEVTSRSKAKSTRSFTGFLVKSYQPIETSLYGEPLLINPPQGLSLFIEDFTHFRLADDVTVVGYREWRKLPAYRADEAFVQKYQGIICLSLSPEFGSSHMVAGHFQSLSSFWGFRSCRHSHFPH